MPTVIKFKDGPLSSHGRVFQRAVVISTRINIAIQPSLDLWHGSLFQVVDNIKGIGRVADPG